MFRIWVLLKRSILQQLWSYPGHNMAMTQVAAPVFGNNSLRVGRLVQYARAINASYLKVRV
jgi:hypothetical protein